MKFPLSWHKDGLRNMRATLARKEHEAACLAASIAFINSGIELSERQIAEAQARGLDSFDPERFLVWRNA